MIAHHYFSDGKWYVDSSFVQKSQGVLPKSELKHMGFGEFYLKTPEGDIQFDRMRGKNFPNQEGRSHQLYDDKGGKLVKKLIDAMDKYSQLVMENISIRKMIITEIKKIFEMTGESAGSMEYESTSLEKAREYAEQLNLLKDIPEFDRNYKIVQKLATLGKTKRKDMPVISDDDVKQFQKRLKDGYVDVNEPFSKTFKPENPFPSGLSGWEAKDFLDRGLRDGSKSDDKIGITIKKKPVMKLKPIQKQIYLEKSIGFIPKFGIEPTVNFLTSKTFFITSDDDFIIDGHHRWAQAIIIDPKMKVNCLSIDLPINKLLPLATAYGDAIGNKRNA